VRFVSLDILVTGVRAFECALSSLMSALVHSRRFTAFLVAFFTIIAPLNRSDLLSQLSRIDDRRKSETITGTRAAVPTQRHAHRLHDPAVDRHRTPIRSDRGRRAGFERGIAALLARVPTQEPATAFRTEALPAKRRPFMRNPRSLELLQVGLRPRDRGASLRPWLGRRMRHSLFPPKRFFTASRHRWNAT
jgi:hypothetical protein